MTLAMLEAKKAEHGINWTFLCDRSDLNKFNSGHDRQWANNFLLGVKRVQWKNNKRHCTVTAQQVERKERNQVDKDLKDKWIMYDRWDPYASKRNF